MDVDTNPGRQAGKDVQDEPLHVRSRFRDVTAVDEEDVARGEISELIDRDVLDRAFDERYGVVRASRLRHPHGEGLDGCHSDAAVERNGGRPSRSHLDDLPWCFMLEQCAV
jgi:hypothetical protein